MQIRKKTKYSLSLITGTLIASLTVALLFVSLSDIRSSSTPIIAVEGIAAESLETQPQPPATIDKAPSVQEPPPVVEDTQESQVLFPETKEMPESETANQLATTQIPEQTYITDKQPIRINKGPLIIGIVILISILSIGTVVFFLIKKILPISNLRFDFLYDFFSWVPSIFSNNRTRSKKQNKIPKIKPQKKHKNPNIHTVNKDELISIFEKYGSSFDDNPDNIPPDIADSFIKYHRVYEAYKSSISVNTA